jgi:hypothetical protein
MENPEFKPHYHQKKKKKLQEINVSKDTDVSQNVTNVSEDINLHI